MGKPPFFHRIIKRSRSEPASASPKDCFSVDLDKVGPERLFRAVCEHAPVMLCVLDGEGRCLAWSKEGERRLGYTFEELRSACDPAASEQSAEAVRRLVGEFVQEKGGTFRELCLTAKDGRLRHQIWASAGLPDNAVIHIGFDTTQQENVRDRLSRINESLLRFDQNPSGNINRLTRLCGELLDADAAFYSRLEGNFLNSTGIWNPPPGFDPLSEAQGRICFDLLSKEDPDVRVISDLPRTPFARSDPNVSKYQFKTYIGKTVSFGQKPVGVLCAVFRRHVMPTPEDSALIKFLALAVGIEERRWQAERALKRSLELEQLITRISTLLSNLSSDRIDDGIEEALKMIGQQFQADRCFVFLVEPDDPGLAQEAYEWDAPGVMSQKDLFRGVSVRQYPWWAGKIRAREVIHIPDPDALPPEAAAEKDILMKTDAQSVLSVPLVMGGRVLGFIGMDAVFHVRSWTTEDIDSVKILGDAIANTVHRKYSEEVLRQQEVRFERQKAALLELGKSQMLDEEDLDVTLREIAEIAAKTIEVERVSIWRCDEARQNITCMELFERSKKRHSCGEKLDLRLIPSYWKMMNEDRVIVAEDVAGNPATREFLESYSRPRNIVSLLDAPVRLAGRTAGVVCLEQTGTPKNWTVEEKRFAGSISDAVALAINQHQRRRAEEALQASEKTLREILNLSPNFIFAKDKDGRFILVNESLAEAYGTTVKDILGKTDADFAGNEEEVRNFRKDDLEVIRTGRKKFIPEEVITDSAGRLRYMQTTKIPFVIHGTEDAAVLGVASDITLRRQAEEALRESEKKYRDLVESSQDLIWSVDAHNRWTFVNRAAASIYGYVSHEMVGRPLSDFMSRDSYQRHAACLAAMKDEVRHLDFEIEHRRKDGRPVFLRFTASALKDKNGRPAGSTGTAVDITEQKKAESELRKYQKHLEEEVEERTRELRQSERLAATGRLAASIAHEINNPLQGIMTHLEILRESLPRKFKKIQNYEFVKTNIEKIGSIVSRLLDTYRMTDARKTDVPINEVLDKVISLIEPQLRRKDIELEFIPAENLPLFQGWPRQIHQVFLNLLLNAHDSIISRGRITIRTMSDDKNIIVVLEDNGEGMEAEVVEHIFDPFFTTKEESGTGLGLFVAQGIVREHGGAIRVRSQKNEGTVFSVYLPIKAETEEDHE